MPLPLAGFFAGLTFARIMQTIAVAIIIRVIVALGITITIYTGLDTGIQLLNDAINDQLDNLGGILPASLAILKRMGMIDFINIQLSAITGVITIKGVSGAIRRISLFPVN